MTSGRPYRFPFIITQDIHLVHWPSENPSMPSSISAPRDRSTWLRASCSSVSPLSASLPDNHDFTGRHHLMLYLNLKVPKWMRASMGATFPNKGVCVGVLGSKHSSEMRLSKVSLSTSFLLYLVLCTTQEGRNVCGIVFIHYNLTVTLTYLIYPFISPFHCKPLMQFKQ